MIGSIAVTSPLAGCRIAIPSSWYMWMYGSRLETSSTSSPASSLRSTERSISGFQTAPRSMLRRLASTSRSSARTSPTSGCRSGLAGCWNGWMIPSPRSSARTPATQPRHDRWAMSTVISDTTTPSRMKNPIRYLRVSALRRSTKLMSCTSTSVPTWGPSVGIANHVTCSGAGGNWRSTCASGPVPLISVQPRLSRIGLRLVDDLALEVAETRSRKGARPGRHA